MKSKVKIELFLNVDRTLWKNTDIIALCECVREHIRNVNKSGFSEGCMIELEKTTDKNITDIV